MTALRVLHIDDEPDIREVVAISLGLDPDLTLRSCASGEEGLEAASQDLPDLILLDVMMPSMDGPTTLALLRQNPHTAGIDVVFMTARAQSREIEQFKLLGAVGVIAKPFDPMTLVALLRSQMLLARDPLAESRGAFVRRVSKDADALFLCWSGFGQERVLPSVLISIRDIAHGLAGSGGIFGFPQLSNAAADLEDAATGALNGTKTADSVERALEALLTGIETHVTGIALVRPKNDA